MNYNVGDNIIYHLRTQRQGTIRHGIINGIIIKNLIADNGALIPTKMFLVRNTFENPKCEMLMFEDELLEKV